MNVMILTLGSRGDVQPYVALGVGLQRAGHRVTLATVSPLPNSSPTTACTLPR